MNECVANETAIRAALKNIWGYDGFRPPQGEIIRSLLQKRDTVTVLPTGGGKSICFQLPALLQSGLTLVVSPLVALMENQVQELRERQLPAALLHSELPSQARSKTLQGLQRNELRLLYLSPETLLSQPVWECLCAPGLAVTGMILDEAHCLVQWGETFRPAYRRLGAVRPALLQSKPPGTQIAIAAFTATADSCALQTIQNVLQLQQPEVFRINPYRPNLHLGVRIAWTPRGRRQQLLKFIQAFSSQVGLVYARTRRDTETLAQWLAGRGYATAAYHAGLSPQQRRNLEAGWLSGKIQFVVCTSAFGMGINKPDVRWVAHFQVPALLSEYVQEVGRAGRDGLPAQALTLISEPTGWLDPEDRQRRQFFEDKQGAQYRKALQLAEKLPAQGEVSAVARKFPDGAIALSLLHSAGRLNWLDPFRYAINPSERAGAGACANAGASAQMTQYLGTRQCRWQFLLQAFGFAGEAKSLRCSHCDNCGRARS
ncbi:RecQ family ATP-dependent DNA helicase [Kamptonema formosum]|uniref:RecQ family ATP-dependent DNA helicase n=1 Tax=Kamptonema formosum TaxID=331992 RepID=UPI0003448ED7|nr:RecQ family ATP-dependent DNA helicase [Oscillatoria sp. PCC 10802]